jgi:hypothetical protein
MDRERANGEKKEAEKKAVSHGQSSGVKGSGKAKARTQSLSDM